MASPLTISSSSEPQKLHASDDTVTTIQAFIESNGNVPIPTTYYSLTEPHRDDVAGDDLAASIPILDFSLLTSPDPQIHADAVRQLGDACREWGFFMITNHGISEKLMEGVIKKSLEFHDLPLEEKMEFFNKELITPVRFGTSSLPYGEKREVAFEYNKGIRNVARTLLERISKSLGLQAKVIVEYTGFDSGHETCQVNLHPPCPQPDLTLGLLPHFDNDLPTFLSENGIKGLQLKPHHK
ncbi:1-aminocyclopropane-1-carboxylate oxidase homolog [Neltuma alba]|uniref:1-aminocyclopropane-1-carboxylate oxidase homolog n=1 Tax=Neltuma alba TaxID=207710 RepID=UPI0010A4AB6C|nr:1-aminocyclopropane-1-carboxylate oxidase homolog [Prosopis alba]